MSERSFYDELLPKVTKEKYVEIIEKEGKLIVRETIDYYFPTEDENINKSCVEELCRQIQRRIEAEKVLNEERWERIDECYD